MYFFQIDVPRACEIPCIKLIENRDKFCFCLCNVYSHISYHCPEALLNVNDVNENFLVFPALEETPPRFRKQANFFFCLSLIDWVYNVKQFPAISTVLRILNYE